MKAGSSKINIGKHIPKVARKILDRDNKRQNASLIRRVIDATEKEKESCNIG